MLINCRNLGYYSADAGKVSEIWDVRQLNWTVHAGDRISFQCHSQEQKDVVWRILLDKLKPKSGLLEITSGTKVYSDEMLWSRADGKADLWTNLQSRFYNQRPWLVDRRVHHSMLVDLIKLTAQAARTPLMQLEESEKIKAWTVMMISARIHVWLVDSSIRDASVEDRSMIKLWLDSFPGAWINFDAGELHSSDYDFYLELDRQGYCNKKERREKQPF